MGFVDYLHIFGGTKKAEKEWMMMSWESLWLSFVVVWISVWSGIWVKNSEMILDMKYGEMELKLLASGMSPGWRTLIFSVSFCAVNYLFANKFFFSRLCSLISPGLLLLLYSHWSYATSSSSVRPIRDTNSPHRSLTKLGEWTTLQCVRGFDNQ